MDNIPLGNAGRSRGRGRASNPQQANIGGRGRRPNPPAQSGTARGGQAPVQAGNLGAWGQGPPGNPGSARSGHTQAPAPTQSAWGGKAPGPAPVAGSGLGAWARGPPGQPESTQAPGPSAAPSAWSGQSTAGAGGDRGAWGKGPVVGSGARGLGPPPGVGPALQPSCSTAAPQQRAPAPTTQGRATAHRDVPIAEAGGVQGAEGGQVVREDSRGAVRGKRVIYLDVVRTKPSQLSTKCGTSGTRKNLLTNYFRVLSKPKWSIHQYRVDFSPDIDLMVARRSLLYHHRERFNAGYIFDGTVMFCPNFFMDQTKEMEIITKNRDGTPVKIKLKHVGILDISDIQQLQVLNLVVRRAMAGLNLQLVGRNYFDPESKISMSNFNMEIWPGYITSMRQHERDILLCVEIAHKVMRTDTIYKILRRCQSECRNDFREKFKSLVVGTIVLTDYNNKTYRVDDIDFNQNALSTFSTKSGDMSYIKYYQDRYKLTVTDPKQPLIVSQPTERNMRGGVDNPIMLIPELCRATGITDEMRKDFRVMRAMSDHTRLAPERRIQRLDAFRRRLRNAEESTNLLRTWDMELEGNLVEINGRELAAEKIFFGKKMIYQCNENADWTREFRHRPMFRHVDMKRWRVILPSRYLPEVQEFVKLCIKAAEGMQMKINPPEFDGMHDDRNGTYSQSIERAVSFDPQLLMVVLVTNNEEKYGCVKKKCCVDRPVPSQVVTLRTIAPRRDKASGLMSIATKVVIQMNAKLLGQPWLVDLPLNGLMTVGYDVCHVPRTKQAYGALVATMDVKESTRFYSNVDNHNDSQEVCDNIAIRFTYALRKYKETHGSLPQRICYYRDGVGDGQLAQVYKNEVSSIRSRIDDLYKQNGGQKPRFAFIVVSKRINTRYFTNKGNPKPGTVVDDVITLPERYDFYLVSQSVRQGTVSPTSYNIIHDTMGLPADKIQQLTYKMTHMYYNWSGTCRVPAVCQYAHKLAYLIGENIHHQASNALENHLYFL